MPRVHLVVIIAVVFLSVILFLQKSNRDDAHIADAPVIASDVANPIVQDELPVPVLREPIADAQSRITKKSFGTKVSPSNSPVSPERFSGYHTGLDVEIMSGEEDIDVVVAAACEGEILVKRSVTGYGGVLVQRCVLDGEEMTVLYGHLRLLSIAANVGDILHAGDRIGVLGTGYSSETSGERKHLHFSVHAGTDLVLAGYVSRQSDLAAWRDPQLYFSW